MHGTVQSSTFSNRSGGGVGVGGGGGDDDDVNNYKNIHIGHSTQTAECADVKVQNILRGRNNITCSAECK